MIERQGCDHRPKYLLAGNGHGGGDVGQDRGLHKVTGQAAHPVAPHHRPCPLGQGLAAHDLHPLQLNGTGQGRDIGIVQAGTDRQSFGQFRHPAHHLVITRTVNQDSGQGRTDLPRIEENPAADTGHNLLQIGVLEHQGRRLATQLHHTGHTTLGGGMEDRLSGGHRTGKDDLVHPRVGHQGGPGFPSQTADDIHQPRGQVFKGSPQQQHPQGAQFRRLDHHGIARRQGRGQGTGCQGGREVPGHDLSRHPVGLMNRIVQIARPQGDGTTLDLIGHSGVVVEIGGGLAKLGPGIVKALAVFQTGHPGPLLAQGTDLPGHPAQGIGPLPGVQVAPGPAIETAPGGSHRLVHVPGVGQGHLGQGLGGSGVLDGQAMSAVHPAPVDQVLPIGGKVGIHGSPQEPGRGAAPSSPAATQRWKW